MAKQRQDQIRHNNEEISRIIKQKKFYLKHKLVFDAVPEGTVDSLGSAAEDQENQQFGRLSSINPDADIKERLIAN